MLPSIRHLQYFVAAASTGQISRAAAVLNVTQSSITIAIKGLEEELGYKLLFRHSKGVFLTSRGEVFLHHAQALLSAAEELMDLPPFDESDIAGAVTVGISYTVSGYFLPRLLTVIKRELPRLKLSLVELPRHDIEEGVRQGTIDLGIILISDVADATGLEMAPLLVSKRQLWIGLDHRFAARETISLQELTDEPYVVVQVDDHEHTMQRNWDKYGFVPNIVFRTQSMEAVRSFVAAGYGISILSDMVHRSWSLNAQRILQKPIEEEISPLITGCIWSSSLQPSPATVRLLEIIRSSSRSGVLANSQDIKR
ncbi:LysR family transcriptional regulator [Rhizobium sp. CFBP 8762]|uniref:LysR family transcriptional regulator n=1 Tax=Rhizobium sp. CFBP 8762 TaxID=2775279 RepID=UPI0017819766|nr:LysR family transcriptional regulator [Rhizobium sp. CFBP 8762]MBD8556080.1 LysR family transcriptional regulator [Rhizobium sp. CFBP 8762]